MNFDDPTGREQSSRPPVRPVGYVEDRPVVRRIGDRELYLGNLLAAEGTQHSHQFEYVLSATHDEQPLTTHHRPLIDGPDNDWASFERAVDTARTLYRTERPTLIHCKAGISRSSTLIATRLSVEEDRSFIDALALVQEARPHAVPHPALHELAVVYLAARS
ncbi:protein-tyrosine phosphatase family protein [Haladaptatus sp. NG-SE-30]